MIGGASVLAVAGSASITWDEAFYMRSVRRNMSWLDELRRNPGQALRQETIDQYWGVAVPDQKTGVGKGDLHPPLVKVASGGSWRLLRGVLGDLVSMRLPGALFFGLAVAVLFVWLSELSGLLAGAAGALLLAAMPRFHAHATLLELDAPLAAVALAATYVYWKTVDRPGWRWAIPFGLAWGLALSAKNGGWLLPIGLGLWTLVYHRTWRHLLRLALAGIVAVCFFVATWPWLYPDLPARLAGFVSFSFLGHSSLLGQYTFYLGLLSPKPPWHYPFVMAAAVLPATILLMALAGLAEMVGQGRAARAGWLLVLSALGPMLPFALGLVAAYDGERLFLSAFPFLAALAALGFVGVSNVVWDFVWRRIPRLAAQRRSHRLRGLLNVALLVLLVLPPLADRARLHPYELSYYGEIVGGVRGAAALGLETTFWGDSYQGVLDYLNNNAPPNAAVWADAYYVLWAYQDLGRLRKDIFVPGADAPDPATADLAVVQTRQSRFFEPVARLMASRTPEWIVSVDGVALALVYRTR